MIKYKRLNRTTSLGKGHQALAILGSNITGKELAKEIEQSTGIPAIRSMSVLDAISSLIAKKITEGYNVNIEGLGHFRAGLVLNDSGDPEIKKVLFKPNNKMYARFTQAEFKEVK